MKLELVVAFIKLHNEVGFEFKRRLMMCVICIAIRGRL
jgi:hypothetical protein